MGFQPGQPVRPINHYNVPYGYGWYGDDWLFRLSRVDEAPQGIVMRPSLRYDRKLVIHIQVCQWESNGSLKITKRSQCWQWAEDFRADDDHF